MFGPLAKCYDGIAVRTIPVLGDAALVFHTYHGALVFVAQTEHRVFAAPDDARTLLRRLHQFNLTWGLFAYGALLIPLLSYCNYLAQKRAIARQVTFSEGRYPQRLLTGVGLLADLIRSNPEAEDDEIVRRLIQEGFHEREAAGLVLFVPIAFTRYIYRASGVRFAPVYVVLGPDQKPHSEGVIAEVPACRAAWAYCLTIENELDLVATAARSGGYKAIQELVESGEELASIETGPPVIHG